MDYYSPVAAVTAPAAAAAAAAGMFYQPAAAAALPTPPLEYMYFPVQVYDTETPDYVELELPEVQADCVSCELFGGKCTQHLDS